MTATSVALQVRVCLCVRNCVGGQWVVSLWVSRAGRGGTLTCTLTHREIYVSVVQRRLLLLLSCVAGPTQHSAGWVVWVPISPAPASRVLPLQSTLSQVQQRCGEAEQQLSAVRQELERQVAALQAGWQAEVAAKEAAHAQAMGEARPAVLV